MKGRWIDKDDRPIPDSNKPIKSYPSISFLHPPTQFSSRRIVPHERSPLHCWTATTTEPQVDGCHWRWWFLWSILWGVHGNNGGKSNKNCRHSSSNQQEEGDTTKSTVTKVDAGWEGHTVKRQKMMVEGLSCKQREWGRLRRILRELRSNWIFCSLTRQTRGSLRC